MAVDLLDLLKQTCTDSALLKKLQQRTHQKLLDNTNKEIAQILDIFSGESTINFNRDNYKAILDKISEADICGSLDKLMTILYELNQAQQQLKTQVQTDVNQLLADEFEHVKSITINSNQQRHTNSSGDDDESLEETLSSILKQYTKSNSDDTTNESTTQNIVATTTNISHKSSANNLYPLRYSFDSLFNKIN